MVKLAPSTYKRIQESIKTSKVEFSLETTIQWEAGECDICHQHAKHMLSCRGCQKDGWLLCGHHGREMGLLW